MGFKKFQIREKFEILKFEKKLGIQKISKLGKILFSASKINFQIFYFHKGFLYSKIFVFFFVKMIFTKYQGFLYKNKNLKIWHFEFFMYKHT